MINDYFPLINICLAFNKVQRFFYIMIKKETQDFLGPACITQYLSCMIWLYILRYDLLSIIMCNLASIPIPTYVPQGSSSVNAL